MEQAVQEIERRAHELGEREIASVWIGEQVMEALRDIDDVSYVRFAIVYRYFHVAEDCDHKIQRLCASLSSRSLRRSGEAA